ncbi:Molybdate transporter 2 [Raphanus sativus]|uniref:Molybdate transporter 2 n=1 Tax=Raphanus sativus TaxID=3726 RepID=A0A6J0MUC1_RAPSA|nr:molybdate transporter 2 [Raphanus sativus]KAJ4874322.1 Molybdate transporter 2 [Raphanus sativus]
METTTTPLLHDRCGWLRRRLRLKNPLSSELSGAVGDLGTFIPIVLTLTLVSNLDLSATLIFTGFYNIATGLLFDIPMPVQPMKSIAAVAVSETPHLTPSQIAAAGASTAATLLLLGTTGAMSFLYNLIPLPVVRGVQLSQGLQFAFTAIKYVRFDYDTATLKPSSSPRSWLGLDGLILALAALLFIILSTGSGNDRDCAGDGDGDFAESSTTNETQSRRRRLRLLSSIPSALIVFLLGLVLCFIRDPSIFKDLRFGPSKFKILKITWDDWKIGFVRAAIPQIPLSVLNSVIAVCKLSNDLFDKELSATTVSVSVGMMNLIGCWFGAMPVCHGAGGLAGQYRFGARSGLSVIFLGVGKLVVGLVFGNSFVRILSQFPIGILGVLLLFAGIELAMASKDMNTKEDSFIMLVCAAVSMTGSSAALGFGCGVLLYLLLKLRTLDSSSVALFSRSTDVSPVA